MEKPKDSTKRALSRRAGRAERCRTPKGQTALVGRLGGGRSSQPGLGRTRRGGVTFDKMSVPGEVTLETVLDMRRSGEAVIFAGIDNELGGAAEALECLVELLGIDDRDVPINFAAHDECGGGDAGDLVERRDLFVESAVFPRKT